MLGVSVNAWMPGAKDGAGTHKRVRPSIRETMPSCAIALLGLMFP